MCIFYIFPGNTLSVLFIVFVGSPWVCFNADNPVLGRLYVYFQCLVCRFPVFTMSDFTCFQCSLLLFLHISSVCSVCSIYISSVYILASVWFIFLVCNIYVIFIFPVCHRWVLLQFFACTLAVLFLFPVCIRCVLSVFPVCTRCVLSVFPVCTRCVLFIFPVLGVYYLYFQCVLGVFYLMAGDVASLINFLGFASWIYTGLIQLSVIILRYTMKDAPRSYKVIS